MSAFFKYVDNIVDVSDLLNFVSNLDVRFNKLVSDKLDLALMRADNEAVSVPLNFVENLDVRFNKLVSDKLDMALIRADKAAVSEVFNFAANLNARFKTEVSVLDAYKA